MRPSISLAFRATLSGLIPNSLITFDPGADAPNLSIETTPSTHLCHPIDTPASTASEGRSGRSTES